MSLTHATALPLLQESLVPVLLPLPLGRTYDYAVPTDMALRPGDWVTVPLGRRQEIGVVWDGAPDGAIDPVKLKPVIARLPLTPLAAANRRFVDWVARYTVSAAGDVLRMGMRAPGVFDPPRPALAYRRADAPIPGDLRITPARRRVLALLEDGPPRVPAELAREAGCTPAVIRGLASAGVLEAVALAERMPFDLPQPDNAEVTLSPHQQVAAEALRDSLGKGAYAAILLDGVTGSGKTEVYFEAVAEAVRQGRQVLILLPEIALSAAFIERFERRFGVSPALWHSDITGRSRRLTWQAVAEGSARVVVGARSALFLPYADLGLIVVDEEHDPAFKQEDGVVYHARDMAVARGRLDDFPVVLVSATPSLETQVNVDRGRYNRLHLPARHGGAQLPDIALVNLLTDPPPRQCWLSPTVRAAVTETLAAGEQALLFLNRRGYAPLTLCRSCGYPMECPNCTAWLVEHRFTDELRCHHCDYRQRMPDVCPACGAEDSFAACGPGVERIEEETRALFPDAVIEVLASDTVTRPAELHAALARIRDGEVDIVIGTQIIAKGHHFPLLTLVAVIDADIGLEGGDLRAGERTYQLLHQVSGRAGRGDRPGRVLIQTHRPEHPVIKALAGGERDAFMQAEASAREQSRMPPFSRMAALIFSGREGLQVEAVANLVSRHRPELQDVRILGPTQAPMALLRGRHRQRMMVIAPREVNIQKVITDWLNPIKLPSSVRIQIDIDPYSFL